MSNIRDEIKPVDNQPICNPRIRRSTKLAKDVANWLAKSKKNKIKQIPFGQSAYGFKSGRHNYGGSINK